MNGATAYPTDDYTMEYSQTSMPSTVDLTVMILRTAKEHADGLGIRDCATLTTYPGLGLAVV